MGQPQKFGARLALAVSIISVITATPIDAKKQNITSIKRQLQQVARNMNQYRSRLKVVKRQKIYAYQNLVAAERKLSISQAKLADIRAQLARTRKKIELTRAELEKTKQRLKKRNELLATRIADTYKHGSMSYIGILLGAADFSDLLSRGYVVRKVLEKDAEIIESIKRDKAAIEQYQAQLEAQERERRRLEYQQEIETRAAAEWAEEKEHNLKRIQSEAAELERALAELEETSRRLGEMLRRMHRAASFSRTNIPMWSGGWLRPVPGAVTSGFGMRMHPILKRYIHHDGIDLRAAYGTLIRAAADGIVKFSGVCGGYGKTVIIYHGGNIDTLYAHCSRLAVSVNQKVKQGQIIGYVGSTGLSTGPHLHFEFRVNGTPKKPPF
ncbi:MAG: peptidoglycan DD-metalloendopeptidase family protein [Armatimonadetes bacterium]|nr:peptidoglycan DD-metalloendopeptidase family protein [Armatimonadota bacterium]